MLVDSTALRTLSDQPTETIGSSTFALVDEIDDQGFAMRANPYFFGIVAAITVAMGLGGRYCVGQIEQGNMLPARIFAILVAASCYGGTLGVVIFLRWSQRARREIPLPLRPPVVPRDAIPARVRVHRAGKVRAASQGWIQFGDGYMTFLGERFSFRLTRGAVKSRNPLRALKGGGPLMLRLPKGLSATAVTVNLGFAVGPKWQSINGWDELAAGIEAWDRSTRPATASVYPPLRSGTRLPRLGTLFLPSVAAGLVVALATLTTMLLLPVDRGILVVLSVALAVGASFGLIFPLTYWCTVLERRALKREIDKVKQKLAGSSQ